MDNEVKVERAGNAGYHGKHELLRYKITYRDMTAMVDELWSQQYVYSECARDFLVYGQVPASAHGVYRTWGDAMLAIKHGIDAALDKEVAI